MVHPKIWLLMSVLAIQGYSEKLSPDPKTADEASTIAPDNDTPEISAKRRKRRFVQDDTANPDATVQSNVRRKRRFIGEERKTVSTDCAPVNSDSSVKRRKKRFTMEEQPS